MVDEPFFPPVPPVREDIDELDAPAVAFPSWMGPGDLELPGGLDWVTVIGSSPTRRCRWRRGGSPRRASW